MYSYMYLLKGVCQHALWYLLKGVGQHALWLAAYVTTTPLIVNSA